VKIGEVGLGEKSKGVSNLKTDRHPELPLDEGAIVCIALNRPGHFLACCQLIGPPYQVFVWIGLFFPWNGYPVFRPWEFCQRVHLVRGFDQVAGLDRGKFHLSAFGLMDNIPSRP
jgi:hypothetical protein